jgi:hypothetical protein
MDIMKTKKDRRKIDIFIFYNLSYFLILYYNFLETIKRCVLCNISE